MTNTSILFQPPRSADFQVCCIARFLTHGLAFLYQICRLGSRRYRDCGLSACRVFCWCILALVLQGQMCAAEDLRAFRFGFSTALMPEINENDSRAAMKVWAETVLKSATVRADPEVRLFRDYPKMLEAMQSNEVDGVAMTSVEYYQLRDLVKINHYVFGVVDGSIADEYLLLVHEASSFRQIEDLRDHTLNIQRHSRMCLASAWLASLLSTNGGTTVQTFFSRVLETEKLTATVLPVFFRKADACVVNRKGFKAMSELNPQVGQRLRVLASSSAVVPTGFFFLSGFPATQQQECLAEFTRLHTTPAGLQILTVFQTERLQEHPATALDNTLKMLADCEKLRSAAPSATPALVGMQPAQGVGK